MGIAASIIVTSYNQASTLKLLLASLERQTTQAYEVLIADDGSSDESLELCLEASRTVLKERLQFVTQPDEGYRKAKIVNEAIRRARAPYLIFLDGDVVLEKHFVADHLRLQKPGHFVCGRRVDLGPMLTRKIKLDDVTKGKFDHVGLRLIWSAWSGDTLALKRAFRIQNPWIRRCMGYCQPLDILGSNFSAWKSDIEAVNGFNESLESYWGEDGDLYIRLRNIGRKAVGAKSLCIQYHLFHSRRAPTPENVQKYQERLNDPAYKWADKGLI